MAQVRAKFKCVKKTATQCSETTGQSGCVLLKVVTEGNKENDDFFHWTPFGEINMGTINEKAFAAFEVGKEYYVDFTIAE